MMKHSAEEYLKEPYTYILIPDEMGGYAAEILEFPGCFAEGETANEAMKKLDSAAAGWIRAALAQGQDIPPPLRNQGYGGKIALRLPKSLHRKAVEFATRDGVSLNQFLVSAIAARVGAEEFCDRLTTRVVEKLKDRPIAAAGKVTNIMFVNYQNAPEKPTASATQQVQPLFPPIWRFDQIAGTTTEMLETVHG
jgi:predicted RNase H-like HicB family nuclease